ncbi:MAG: aromatic-ring-hydroxylating dioxygenase subunit beta [Variovorax sp.]|nr:aromatic-ring-hydroxylating dioxygenase subunit beta [Variovorax sp.]
MLDQLITFNADYAAAIDDGRLEDWPAYFIDDCFYRITTADNHARGLPAGLVYADSRQMLHDRVLSLRKANVFERQRYRHLLSLPRIREDDGEVARVETGFAVLRTVRGGPTEIFAGGCYFDEVVRDGKSGVKLRKRDVVCDSPRIDTLLAIPL